MRGISMRGAKRNKYADYPFPTVMKKELKNRKGSKDGQFNPEFKNYRIELYGMKNRMKVGVN